MKNRTFGIESCPNILNFLNQSNNTDKNLALSKKIIPQKSTYSSTLTFRQHQILCLCLHLVTVNISWY